ncbi:MAG: nucleotide sugar dehydrogenase [Chloroflexi bacterium]|nr:nucleotide sugar dehydrogenase [Chloroflexota bacterium]
MCYTPLMDLLDKIRDKSARVAIVGLGYVGLPLATGFAKVGFRVLGVDVNAEKVGTLNQGKSYIPDVPSADVADLVTRDRFQATTDFGDLIDADVIFICVPTPITPAKVPDLSFIVSAAQGVGSRIKRGQLVILQSTTHPGTTEEDVLPILEKRSGLVAGRDFYLAFCPERINPGDAKFGVENTPKVVGGLTPESTTVAAGLMACMGAPVHTVSSPRTAEMAKLLENTFRSVNIALVNELAKLCERMGIDVWEVIEAASTKPFGFMPFYPGPGVGGHCIPVDPFYLSWKARELDFYTHFIELAAEVNQSMPYHTVDKVVKALGSRKKPLAGAKVVVLGVAFKKDIDDARNSVAERIILQLLNLQAEVVYNDPNVPVYKVGAESRPERGIEMRSVDLTDSLIAGADCVLIVTGHSQYDYQHIVDTATLVVDSCNATKHIAPPAEGRIFKVGRPD